MIPLLLSVAPMLLRFVGDGVLERHYNAKVEIAKSETGLKKAQIDADVKKLGHEMRRREAQRDLQIAELERPALFLPKAILFWSASLYLSAIIMSSLLGLKTRYGLIIEDVPPSIWNVIMLVVGYWTLDNTVRLWKR